MGRTIFRRYQAHHRFSVKPSDSIDGGWMLIDNLDGCRVDFDTKVKARQAAAFARAYVSWHGDIDLASFPQSIDQPYHFEAWEGREPRPWQTEENER